MTMNPYVAPQSDAGDAVRPATGDIWRSGNILIMAREETTLPDRCVKCNAPSEGYFLKRRLAWHPPWVYFLLLAGLLFFVIGAVVTQKRATVHVGLCPRHRALRRNTLLFAAGCFGMMLASCAGGVAADEPALFLLPVVFLSAGLVALVVATVVKPKKIDAQWLHLSVGRPFLESFPDSGPWGSIASSSR